MPQSDCARFPNRRSSQANFLGNIDSNIDCDASERAVLYKTPVIATGAELSPPMQRNFSHSLSSVSGLAPVVKSTRKTKAPPPQPVVKKPKLACALPAVPFADHLDEAVCFDSDLRVPFINDTTIKSTVKNKPKEQTSADAFVMQSYGGFLKSRRSRSKNVQTLQIAANVEADIAVEVSLVNVENVVGEPKSAKRGRKLRVKKIPLDPSNEKARKKRKVLRTKSKTLTVTRETAPVTSDAGTAAVACISQACLSTLNLDILTRPVSAAKNDESVTDTSLHAEAPTDASVCCHVLPVSSQVALMPSGEDSDQVISALPVTSAAKRSNKKGSAKRRRTAAKSSSPIVAKACTSVLIVPPDAVSRGLMPLDNNEVACPESSESQNNKSLARDVSHAPSLYPSVSNNSSMQSNADHAVQSDGPALKPAVDAAPFAGDQKVMCTQPLMPNAILDALMPSPAQTQQPRKICSSKTAVLSEPPLIVVTSDESSCQTSARCLVRDMVEEETVSESQTADESFPDILPKLIRKQKKLNKSAAILSTLNDSVGMGVAASSAVLASKSKRKYVRKFKPKGSLASTTIDTPVDGQALTGSAAGKQDSVNESLKKKCRRASFSSVHDIGSMSAVAEKIRFLRRSSLPPTSSAKALQSELFWQCKIGNDCMMTIDVERQDEENRTELCSSVQCTECKGFVHICCINQRYGVKYEKRAQFERFEQFCCPACSPKDLKTKVFTKPTNSHRHNAWEENPPDAIQTASPDFVRLIVSMDFPDARKLPVMLHMRGRDVQLDFFERYGFRTPILIEEPTGLSLTVPESCPTKAEKPFTYDTVLELCGKKRRVNCIDSRAQERYNVDMKEFVDYITGRTLADQKANGSILLNVVSLEFADLSAMKELFEPPAVVKEMSWADSVMPVEKRIIIPKSKKDELNLVAHYEHDYSVEYFCLMGAAGSFTDFHIDFGGSCVFYHIMRGKKVFYLAPPTERNMQLYRQYEASDSKIEFVDGSDNFFKLMEANNLPIYRLELVAGNTVLLPAGWIHSVHTPEDSLVFGGNFLNHLCIPTQLEIYRMEQELKYPRSDRYHNFEINCVYAIDDLVYKLRLQENVLREQRKQKQQVPSTTMKQYQVYGLKKLVDFVEEMWLNKGDNRMDASRYKLYRRNGKIKPKRFTLSTTTTTTICDNTQLLTTLPLAGIINNNIVNADATSRNSLAADGVLIRNGKTITRTKSLRSNRLKSCRLLDDDDDPLYDADGSTDDSGQSPVENNTCCSLNTTPSPRAPVSDDKSIVDVDYTRHGTISAASAAAVNNGMFSPDADESKLLVPLHNTICGPLAVETHAPTTSTPVPALDVDGVELAVSNKSKRRIGAANADSADDNKSEHSPSSDADVDTQKQLRRNRKKKRKPAAVSDRSDKSTAAAMKHRTAAGRQRRLMALNKRHAERDGESEETISDIVRRASFFLQRLVKRYGILVEKEPEFEQPPFEQYTFETNAVQHTLNNVETVAAAGITGTENKTGCDAANSSLPTFMSATLPQESVTEHAIHGRLSPNAVVAAKVPTSSNEKNNVDVDMDDKKHDDDDEELSEHNFAPLSPSTSIIGQKLRSIQLQMSDVQSRVSMVDELVADALDDDSAHSSVGAVDELGDDADEIALSPASDVSI